MSLKLTSKLYEGNFYTELHNENCKALATPQNMYVVRQ